MIAKLQKMNCKRWILQFDSQPDHDTMVTILDQAEKNGYKWIKTKFIYIFFKGGENVCNHNNHFNTFADF